MSDISGRHFILKGLMVQKQSKKDLFEELTWRDIRDWAGATILDRGKKYQQRGLVHELAATPDGEVVAWVMGTLKYATVVDFEGGELVSHCTCPYGNTCKHAVAVVLEYLDLLKKGIDVPAAARQDHRLELIDGYLIEEDLEDYDEFNSSPSGKDVSLELSAFLSGKTTEQLIVLIEELAQRHPNVLRDLQDQYTLSSGNVEKIVRAVRSEIYELSSEPAWSNHWNNEGHIPDYSHVKDCLETLLDQGHVDEVVALGEVLLDKGIEQVEISHDDGETTCEIVSCLDVVFQAVPLSTFSSSEQILWMIDAELKDDYDICQGTVSFWEEEEYILEDWDIVATELMERLKNDSFDIGGDSYSHGYQRKRLSDWVIHALGKADRFEEIIPLCEQEAEKTGSYVRLVKYLKDAKRWQDAEQWIRRGIKDTQKKWPGIANQLRNELREMREQEGDWSHVAALLADDFLREPSLHTFQEMEKTAKKADVLSYVRKAALLYLETGNSPQSDSAWPLPGTGLTENAGRRPKEFPMSHVLIDIAIAEKRPDDVLRWYDYSQSRSGNWGWSGYQDDAVAAAVADRYPDRALAVWKRCAEGHISLTKPKAYHEAAIYLRKIHKLFKKEGREKEWRSYLTELRQVNHRKRRLLEILDELAGSRIIDVS